MLKKFTIGQLSALFNINIQTLYFYDKVGILIPAFRDPKTGLRNYSFKQVQELSTILYLRKCGFSIDEIKNIKSDLTPERAKEKLIEKTDQIMKQWEEIIKLNKAIHKNLKYVEDELGKIEKDSSQIIYRKKRYFIEIGEEETAYGTQELYYYPLVVCYFNIEKVFGALIEHKTPNIDNFGPIITIPNGEYLIEYHKGPYTTIYEHQKEIMQNHPELEFTGDIYTFDIVDQMNCSDTNDFITKMEFQLIKKE